MTSEGIKQNIINLVRDHKKKCPGFCDVSLLLVLELIKMAGIKLTDKEMEEFL